MTSEAHREAALNALSALHDVLGATERGTEDTAVLRASADSALTNALLAIHAELRRGNEQRDRWAEQVVRVLSEAKE